MQFCLSSSQCQTHNRLSRISSDCLSWGCRGLRLVRGCQSTSPAKLHSHISCLGLGKHKSRRTYLPAFASSYYDSKGRKITGVGTSMSLDRYIVRTHQG